MSKVGFATDPHLSSHNPYGRSDDYAAACLSKMNQFSGYARQRGWEAAVITGDLFNLSSVARWFETSVIEILVGFPCPVYCVAGNHDLKARRVGALDEVILGSFFKAGVVRNLVEESVQLQGMSVQGMHFYTEPEGKVPEALSPKSWLVCHQFVAESAGQETLSFSEIRDKGYAGVVAGHEHADVGTQDHDGLLVVRSGSLLRKENADFNRRQPRLVEVSWDGAWAVNSFEVVAGLPEEVFLSKSEDFDREDAFDIDKMREFAQTLENRGFLADGHGDVNLMEMLVTQKGLRVGSEVHACISEFFDKFGLR